MEGVPCSRRVEDESKQGHRRDLIRSLLLGALLAVMLLLNLGGALDKGDLTEYVETTSERTLASFAIARVINAGISVIQAAEIGVSIGVSANIKPGEVLDPINDLVERFSLMMLISATAFWILRIFGELLYDPALLISLGVLYVVGLAALISGASSLQRVGNLLHRMTAIIFAAVIFAVLTPIAVDQLHSAEFVQSNYQDSLANLIQAGDGIESLAGHSSGWDIGKRLEESLQEAKKISEQVTKELVIQLAVVVLEAILLPLMMLWLTSRFIGYELRRIWMA
ncbi:hypothetical protein BOW53_13060 [Solemya pervernicosa gill symbiont]|uniref:Uncharacterized protein n=1 Tax=Solemya pervernicosa gill symbiont TaxID=642797 RepID=A0A1T2L1U1_9GAMM|nr:hypothetical protein [Solemya pervernicosa gill symbiont]OOZ39059.1 hypothetical protein BOW53_13060 [Solemya pervernicosa gill symbiont]